MSFEIIPAIDLKNGEVVRLTRGVMDSAKMYDTNPVAVAQRFEEMGARWLHLIDLDGAIAGKPVNLDVITQIRKQTNLQIELGGGIRNEDGIKRYLELGINRMILGSVAMRDPLFTISMAEKYPIVVGIDAKDGFVSVSGWVEQGKMQAVELAELFRGIPLAAIICTDIGQDGTLGGINFAFREEIDKLRQSKLGGVIVGKAFYEGRVNLERVLQKLN